MFRRIVSWVGAVMLGLALLACDVTGPRNPQPSDTATETSAEPASPGSTATALPTEGTSPIFDGPPGIIGPIPPIPDAFDNDPVTFLSFRFYARNPDGSTILPPITGHVLASTIDIDGNEGQYYDESIPNDPSLEPGWHHGPQRYDERLPMEHVAGHSEDILSISVKVTVDSLPVGAYLECIVFDENGPIEGTYQKVIVMTPGFPTEITCFFA